MSDWGDEEETGRGFGNSCDQHGDHDFENGANDFNDFNDGNLEDVNRGFGNRRGRDCVRGGRGGRGGGYAAGRRNNDDQNGNAHQNQIEFTANCFAPSNFMVSTVKKFLLDVPRRIHQTNDIAELYCIVRYVLKAYKIYISTISAAESIDHIECEKDEFDFDQKYFFNVIRNEAKLSYLVSENIDETNLIGDKNIADSNILRKVNHFDMQRSQLSYLPELLQGSMEHSTHISKVASNPRIRKRKSNFILKKDSQNIYSNKKNYAAASYMVSHVAEDEYALRKRLPMRKLLKIEGKWNTMVSNASKIDYSFFPLAETWANNKIYFMELDETPICSDDQIRFEDFSTGISSINVARHQVSASSSLALPVINLAQSQSEGQSSQLFEENFDTLQDVRDVLQQNSENTGILESNIVSGSIIENTFFTPDHIKIPLKISAHFHEKSLRTQQVQTTAGSSVIHRTEVLQSKNFILPSIREEEFQRKLLRRTIRDAEFSSTPVGHLRSEITERKTTNIFGEELNAFGRDLNKTCESISKQVSILPMEAKIISSLNTEMLLQRHDLKFDEQVLAPAHLSHLTKEVHKNWVDVLRDRNLDVRYFNKGRNVGVRRRKRRRALPHSIHKAAVDNTENGQIESNETLQALSPLPNQLPIPDFFHTAAKNVFTQESSTQAFKQFSKKGVAHLKTNFEMETKEVLMKQPTYDRFVFENIDSISTILDSLGEWLSVIKAFKQDIDPIASVSSLPVAYTYDLNTLLEAKLLRLQIKIDLLKEIICNVTVDITKTHLLGSRKIAAIALHFLLDLESAGIIRIRRDIGNFVELV